MLSSIEIVSYGSQQCTAVARIKRVSSLKYVTQLLVMATSQDEREDNCCWLVQGLQSPVQPTSPAECDGGHYCKDLIEMSPSITPLVAGLSRLVMVVQISHYYALTSHLPEPDIFNQQQSVSPVQSTTNELWPRKLKVMETENQRLTFAGIFHPIQVVFCKVL